MRYGPLRRILPCAMGHCAEYYHALWAKAHRLVMHCGHSAYKQDWKLAKNFPLWGKVGRFRQKNVPLQRETKRNQIRFAGWRRKKKFASVHFFTLQIFLLCFASNTLYFCFVLLPIFSFRFKVKRNKGFLASFHFFFCYTIKQNEKGYRLKKLKAILSILHFF
jgi:hypothetical protein